MEKADHTGHRARMKKKLLTYGLDAFEPHEVLEVLLYYAIPQRNTNDIAKNLIDRFGCLSAVFDASLEMLKNAGLTEHQALFLTMIPDVTRRYMVDKYEDHSAVPIHPDYPKYIRDRFIGYEQREHVLLILMDQKGKEVYSGMIAHGDFFRADISVRDIMTLAINYGGVYAVIAHSHPSGMALPSSEDVRVTRELKTTLMKLGIKLLDHYIVADHDCVSLAESGII